MDAKFQEVLKTLEEAFKEQDRYEALLMKAKKKQENANVARSVVRLMNDYTVNYDSYRILFSFIFGMKKDEIKTLYLGQGISQRDGMNAEEQFEMIINGLIEDGWLRKRDDGEVEVDYEFFECLDEVDKGVI